MCTSQEYRQCQFATQLVDSIFCQVSSILLVVQFYLYFISSHLWFQFHLKNVATELALNVFAVVRSNSECRLPSRVCGCYSPASCSSVCCTGWCVTDVACALDNLLYLFTIVGVASSNRLKEIVTVSLPILHSSQIQFWKAHLLINDLFRTHIHHDHLIFCLFCSFIKDFKAAIRWVRRQIYLWTEKCILESLYSNRSWVPTTNHCAQSWPTHRLNHGYSLYKRCGVTATQVTSVASTIV